MVDDYGDFEFGALYWHQAVDDFCRVVHDEESDLIVLATPDGDDRYWWYEDEAEFHPSDFSRVDPQAVVDPAGYIEEFLEQTEDTSTVGLGHPMIRASFRWARRNTKVVEIDNEKEDN